MRSITTKNRFSFCVAFTTLVLSLAAASQAGVIGAAGDVYVSDGDLPGVYQYDGLTGAHVPNVATGYFAARPPRVAYGNAWGPDGNLYVANNGVPGRWSVDKFDGNTGALLATVLSLNNTSMFSIVKGVAFGPDGDLYVGNWAQL